MSAQFYVAVRNGEVPNWAWVDYCPVCGENSRTVECEHCGTDIARENEKAERLEVERFTADMEVWS